MMEGQHRLGPSRQGSRGLGRMSVPRRGRQDCGGGGIVVVVGQADVRAVSRGFLVMQQRLPASLLQQRLFRFTARYRVVVFNVADIGFVTVRRRSVQHFFWSGENIKQAAKLF